MKKLTISVLILHLLLSCNTYNSIKMVEGFAIDIELKEVTPTTVKIQLSDNMEKLITDKADPLLELVTLDFYRSGHKLGGNTLPAYEYSCWIINVITEKAIGFAYQPEYNIGTNETIPFHELMVDFLSPNTLYELIIYYDFSTYNGIPPGGFDESIPIPGLKPYVMTYIKKFPFRTLSK